MRRALAIERIDDRTLGDVTTLTLARKIRECSLHSSEIGYFGSNITQMRIRDPRGRWKAHPDYPNLMVRAKPDEPGDGTFYL